MRSEVQKVAWRSYWPVAVLAITFLLVVGIFSVYVEARQHAADLRAERQRRAICAILANIPGHIPADIARARVVFARHPRECQPITRPTPKATPAAAVTLTPSPGSAVVIVRPAPQSTVRVTATPRPRPTAIRSASPQPTATPSPSRICVPLTHLCA